MPKVTSSLTATATGAFFATTLFAATPTQVAPPVQQQSAQSAADDPYAELFAQTCNRCHDGARITAIRRTKTEWEEDRPYFFFLLGLSSAFRSPIAYCIPARMCASMSGLL